MRFSDMMGSGAGPPAADESDTELADAPSPYSDDPQPEVPAEVPVTAEVPVVVAEVAPPPVAAPPAPPAPVTPIPVAVGPVAEEPIAISLADFTPFSDDLLPRRG